MCKRSAVWIGSSIVCLALGVRLAAADSAEIRRDHAIDIAREFLEYCIAPTEQAYAYTCVIQEVLRPDPKKFDAEIYGGLDRSDPSTRASDLFKVRSEKLAWIATGLRNRLVREYSSECVYSFEENELATDFRPASIGAIAPAMLTNYSVCRISDAKATLGFKGALATPGTRAVVTWVRDNHVARHSVHLLNGVEPELVFMILAAASQTNTMPNYSPCSPLWQDYSQVFEFVNVDSIKQQMGAGRIFVSTPGTEGGYEIRISLNDDTVMLATYTPKAEIKVPLIEVRRGSTLLRRSKRTLVAGKAWFAEWSNEVPPEQVAKTVYYLTKELTTPELELERFREVYISRAVTISYQDASGHMVDDRPPFPVGAAPMIAQESRIGGWIIVLVIVVIGVSLPVILYRDSRRRD